MRTTIELTPEAWHHAKAVARERNESLGKVVSEFILARPEKEREEGAMELGTSAAGFPTFSSGRPITSEEVKAMLDEMEQEEVDRCYDIDRLA